MSLLQFLRILAARRLIIIVSLLSCVGAAFIVTLLLPPRYEAQSRLMLDLVKPDPVTGTVIATQFARAYTRTQVELVRDQRVASQVVDMFRLDQDPQLQQEYLKADPGKPDFRTWLTQRIIANTEARLIEGSNILEIAYKASTPQAAKQIADALRQAYIDASLSFRKESARRTADWYADQARKAQQALQQAEAAKTDFERKNNLILEGGTDLDSTRLQALAGQAGPSGGVASGPLAPTPSSAQLAQVDASIAQASQTLGPNHPEMLELRNRRAALSAQIVQERSAAAAAAGAAARAANAGAGAASQEYQAQRSRVIAKRDELEQLRRLQAEVDVRREQYVKTATRAAELRQEAEVTDAGLTLLGSAVLPSSPAFPNKPLILLGAFGFGLAFGVLLALLLELLNRRVRSVEDMSTIVEVPLLAVITGPSDRGRGEPALLGWSGRQ